MSFIITDGIGIVIPIDRSGGPKIAGLHRVIPLANGPNCDLIPKLLSFSFHHAAFGAQSLGTQRAVANLVQPLLGSCFRDDDRFFFFFQWNPLFHCVAAPPLYPPHRLFLSPLFTHVNFKENEIRMFFIPLHLTHQNMILREGGFAEK